MSSLIVISMFLGSALYGQEEPETILGPIKTDNYVHEWVKFPAIHGQSVTSRRDLTINATRGKILVALFVGSWCIPCQKMMDHFRAMERKLAKLPIEFVYIFSHDTRYDAVKFSKEHDVKTGVVADLKLIKKFHNPTLPSIYFSDKYGFMEDRIINVDQPKLEELSDYLILQTAM